MESRRSGWGVDDDGGGGGGGGGGDAIEVEAKDDSDMEGWEDDGWDSFNTPATTTTTTQKEATSTAKKEMSSGADFFDSVGFDSSRTRTAKKDPFENFGYSSGPNSSRSKDPTPPPLTSASLFGDAGGKVSGTREEDEGGWGDWNDSFDAKPASSKVIACVYFGL